MSTPAAAGVERPSAAEAARFTTAVALLAIFLDAAVGHALTWENDPYWTYWVTKTFLIATIFGLGTMWFGIGLGRGAVIAAVHTLVLTVYYWSLSPIGLPSSPEWLDLEHTWLTGVPIHFGVIYLGYVVAVWLWRRRGRVGADDARAAATAALVSAVLIVVAAGGLASLALGAFPGLTWFVVRLLLTVPFLLWWRSWAGADRAAAITGGLMLAFVWATYGHYLGPVGLPDSPYRIFDTVAPPATVEFLDYRQLWMISFPIYAAVMILVLLLAAGRSSARGGLRRPAGATAAVAAGLLLLGSGPSGATLGQDGAKAALTAGGSALIETGAYYSDEFEEGSGEITVDAEDMGGRVTPLPPRDRLQVAATVESGGQTIGVTVTEALVGHPTGDHTTWWGVGLDVWHHGESGIGTDRLPPIRSELAAFGLGEVTVDGELAATGVPVHVMTAEEGLPEGARLELDVGMPGMEIPALPAGHLRALWSDYSAEIEDVHTARYAIGVVVMVLLLAGAVWLARREGHRDRRA